MDLNKKNLSVLYPIILACVLALGVYIGIKLPRNNFLETHKFMGKSNKLDLLLELITSDYVDTVKKVELIENTIPLVLKNLDPHSVYIPASELKEVNEPLEGNFEGIGIQFNIQNDTILVVATINGGPSEKKGIQAGDRIIKINDSTFVGKKVTSESVMKKLRGPKGSEVKLAIKRRGNQGLIDFDVIRDKIPIYSLDVAYMVSKSIGYIKFSRFARTTHDELLAGIRKLKALGMNKLILDLRSNGGGFLEEATLIADEFLDDTNLIVYTEGKARKRQNYYSKEGGDYVNGDLIILVDSWSASASEILAGAIQDNDRGIIIGQRTYGKGLVQEPKMFYDSSVVRLTIARYYTPTGRCIQRPYDKGNEDYYDDINKRYLNGELQAADSTKFNDSLKFVTKGGKVVYGGGGIMPDIFVPMDTTGTSKYLTNIIQKGLIYRFALDYADNNRAILKKLDNYKLIKNYLDQQNILNIFVNYADIHGIKNNPKDILVSKAILLNQLKAFITRDILDNDGFYPVLNENDPVVNKAVDVLTKGIKK